MTMTRSSRRAFFRTFAGAGFAAVFMRHLVSAAEAGSYPLRLVIFYTHDGRDDQSRCSGTGANFSLGRMYSELEPIKNKLMVLDGIRIPEHVDEEHPNGRASMLTGRPSTESSWNGTGISIDRFLAKHLSAGESLYTGLESPRPGELDAPISWHAPQLPNTSFITGPTALADHLFAGIGPAPTVPVDDGQAQIRRSNELALNSYLTEEVRRIERVAPAEEKAKLQLHLEALTQLRSVIEGTQGGGTVPLRSCQDGMPTLATDPTEQVNQLIAHGLACGRVRIAVVRVGGSEPHHEYSHEPDPTKLRAMDREYNQHFVNMVKYLDSYQEGDGTLLDNTLLVWTTEVSGSHGGEDIHGTTDVPFIIAGGKNARLRVGERIVTQGRWNTELYRGIARALGVTDTTEFGNPALSGAVDDIFA